MTKKKFISPSEAAEKMRRFASDMDTEASHGDMDDLMLDILRQFGYEEAADIFENADRWYA